MPSAKKRRTVRHLMRQKGEVPIVALTAYTYPVARWADEAADVVLVGDSLFMVLYGENSTLQSSVDVVIHHGAAVVRGSENALVVVDLPFGSYEESPEQAFATAARILKETGAQAVKIEGHDEMVDTVRFLTERGIPVMGHVGLRPQHVHQTGGFRIQGREKDDAAAIFSAAEKIAVAGAFAIVIESVPESLADEITAAVPVPTIGIGASPRCDGQIMVTEDILGLTHGDTPGFVKKYCNLGREIEASIQEYAADVRAGTFGVDKR